MISWEKVVSDLTGIEYSLSGVRPEMVDCGSDQGRSVFGNAGVMSLRRVFQKCENADMGLKMPFMDGHYLV
jgi:hypothetical protein